MPYAFAMTPVNISDPAFLKRKVLLAWNAGDDHQGYLLHVSRCLIVILDPLNILYDVKFLSGVSLPGVCSQDPTAARTSHPLPVDKNATDVTSLLPKHVS